MDVDEPKDGLHDFIVRHNTLGTYSDLVGAGLWDFWTRGLGLGLDKYVNPNRKGLRISSVEIIFIFG